MASRIRTQGEVHQFSGQKDPLHVTLRLVEYDKVWDRYSDDRIRRAGRTLYVAKKAVVTVWRRTDKYIYRIGKGINDEP